LNIEFNFEISRRSMVNGFLKFEQRLDHLAGQHVYRSTQSLVGLAPKPLRTPSACARFRRYLGTLDTVPHASVSARDEPQHSFNHFRVQIRHHQLFRLHPIITILLENNA
jgi:hypothetical protein